MFTKKICQHNLQNQHLWHHSQRIIALTKLSFSCLGQSAIRGLSDVLYQQKRRSRSSFRNKDIREKSKNCPQGTTESQIAGFYRSRSWKQEKKNPNILSDKSQNTLAGMKKN